MKLRDQTKFKLKAIFITVLISGMIGVLYARLIRYNQPIDLLHGFFIGVGMSLSISVIDSFFLRAWMKRRSFTAAVLLKTAYNLMAIIGVLIISSAIFDENGPAALRFGNILTSPEERDTIY
jgi:hypothetical protein